MAWWFWTSKELLCFFVLQVLSILQEVFPAVEAAETAVKLRPLWWEGWQTLGRAQLNLGEVDLVSVAEHDNSNKKKRKREHGVPSRTTTARRNQH